MNISRERILTEFAYTKFKKVEKRNPCPIIESSLYGKFKYSYFHKKHDQEPNDCINLKVELKG